MTRQVINNGISANDGTGDTLRNAATKINANFQEIYSFLGSGSGTTLSTQVSLEDSAVVFEGASTDDYEIRLTASDATADRIIRLPNADGNVVIDTATQTLTNKTLTSPKVGTAINDTYGNELIKFTATDSADNEVTITNNTTGNAPVISATGTTDTNINLRLDGKGTGSIAIRKLSLRGQDTTNLTADAAVSYLNYTSASSTITVADGTSIGEEKVFTNTTGGAITIQPTNFAQGTSISLADNGGLTLIWNNSEWFIVGHYGATVS